MDERNGFVINTQNQNNALNNILKSGADDENAGNLTKSRYTIPGVLHYLQTEWVRFETERSQWDVEKAELQARIAFLQGERKGQENLKQDLVRRIKMLEFALKQERIKFHRLKFGSDVQNDDSVSTVDTVKVNHQLVLDPAEMLAQTTAQASASNAKWKQGRQMLRQYLQEIGYTDAILDVRQARVRQLLGIASEDSKKNLNTENGGQSQKNGSFASSRTSGDDKMSNIERSVIDNIPFFNANESELGDEDEICAEITQQEENILADDEEDALAEFDFLVSQQEGENNSGSPGSRDGGESGSETDSSSSQDGWVMDEKALNKLKEKYREERGKSGSSSVTRSVSQRPNRATLATMLASLGPDENLSSASGNSKNSSSSDTSGTTSVQLAPSASVASDFEMDDPDLIDKSQIAGYNAALGLGDLATITVANEAEFAYKIDGSVKECVRKTWSAKYTLRSHFDSIRTVAFHPLEPVLLTGSEDHTIKMWNLNKSMKGAKSVDVEPIYTFRGHVSPVLSLIVDPQNGDQAFSGGLDGQIRIWNLPSSLIDPYDSFDSSVMGSILEGHSDAVWSLSMNVNRPNSLLSAASDGTIRLWKTNELLHQLQQTFRLPATDCSAVPSSVCYCSHNPDQLVVGTTSGALHLLDIASGTFVHSFKQPDEFQSDRNCQVNRVVSHPTQPITIVAHEDHTVRFYDNNSGFVTHCMKAHLDAVTSLAVDPNGLYLLSASHDCSIRLWNLDNKTCVQEITSHRKKFDESINDVAFHPSKPFLASAGADALAKVFV